MYMAERYWVTERQLNQLVRLRHMTVRETLVKEIFKWQLMGDFSTPEAKKIFKQALVQMLYQFGKKENGKTERLGGL
jgi:hypothetical protein